MIVDDLMEMLVVVLLPFAQIAAALVLVILLSIILLATIWKAIGLNDSE